MGDTRTAIRTCPLCESMCGLELTVEDDDVTLIRANKADVFSKGYLCPKGTTLGHLHRDPDRLRVPLIRDGDGFREASWEEAFAETERLLRGVIDQDGMDGLAVYIGNPAAHNLSLAQYIPAFMGMCGTRHVYSAGTVDQWPKNVAVGLMYGGMWTIPLPDLDRTEHLLIMGANPAASQGSLVAVADFLGRIDDIKARGGRVIVIDPRRTKTAERAGEWVPIVPGTDAYLLMAMVHVLFAEGLVDLAHLDGKVNGLDEVRALAEKFPPDAVAATCGIDAGTIRQLAVDLAEAGAGSVYARIGTCNQEFGTLASWLVEVVNICTGNLDRPGGSMFAKAAAWSLSTMPPLEPIHTQFGRWHSRVRGAPEVLGQVPVSCLAEEIATPGDGQIKGLVTIAGNPCISAPDAAKLDAALPGLDAMICVDNWLNETTRHAHVILPGESALEAPHYDTLITNWSTRNFVKWSDPVFPPAPERPREWEVLMTLGAICIGAPVADLDLDRLDDGFFEAIVEMASGWEGSPIAGRDPKEIRAATQGRGPERFLDMQIRTGPYGEGYGTDPGGFTLEKIQSEPNGIDLGPLEPRIDEVVTTPSGKIELAPAHICSDLDRLAARLDRPRDEMVLIGRRDLRSNNSWMHNVKVLIKGKDRCTLLVHPDDAGRFGVADGDLVCITSEAGSVTAPAEVSTEMMPGVVSLPHGWGHDTEGAQLSVAATRPGTNSNLLAPGHLVDVPSGNAVVNGIPVTLVPA